MRKKIEIISPVFGEFKSWEPDAFRLTREFMNTKEFKVPSTVEYKEATMEISKNKVITVINFDGGKSDKFEFIWEVL